MDIFSVTVNKARTNTPLISLLLTVVWLHATAANILC